VTRWASAGGAGGDPAVFAAERAARDSAGSAGGAGGDPVLVAAAEAAGDSVGVGGRRRRRSGGGRGGGEEVSSRDSIRSRGWGGSVLLHFCVDCSIPVPSRLHLSFVMSYGPQLTCIGAPS